MYGHQLVAASVANRTSRPMATAIAAGRMRDGVREHAQLVPIMATVGRAGTVTRDKEDLPVTAVICRCQLCVSSTESPSLGHGSGLAVE